jgi:hypothetical protein
LQPLTSDEFRAVWRVFGNQGNLWIKAGVSVDEETARSGYQVTFYKLSKLNKNIYAAIYNNSIEHYYEILLYLVTTTADDKCIKYCAKMKEVLNVLRGVNHMKKQIFINCPI